MTDITPEAVERFIAYNLTELARSEGMLVSEEDVDTCKTAAATLRAQAARIKELEGRIETWQHILPNERGEARAAIAAMPPQPEEDPMVPCPAMCGPHTNAGICGLCGTEEEVPKSVADEYIKYRGGQP